MADNYEMATFALGCFWKPDQFFSSVPGVKEVVVGYTGGTVENPTYEMVCSDETGHAEALQIKFDPQDISYEKLLEMFFEEHDPTQYNRQGPDVGSQYRSAVFYHNEDQKNIAEMVKDRWESEHGKDAVTQIVEAGPFYRAEDYHQKYLEKK